jgi:hypothetical protein
VARGPGSRLLGELSSGAATRFSALDLVSLPRWALALPRVPWLWALLPKRRASALPRVSHLRTSPLCRGRLRRCHMAPASPLREESSGAATYPTTLSGLWTTGIKKGLAASDTQLGSHVSKTRSRVVEAHIRRANMSLQLGSTVQHSPN